MALGRIAGVHAGPDGITRVVDVKTAKGVIPVVRLRNYGIWLSLKYNIHNVQKVRLQ